jgi:hypothetical protein
MKQETNFYDGWKFKHQVSVDTELIDLPHDVMIHHEKRNP